MNVPKNPFAAGTMVFGGLVPWRGEWYWSGKQELFVNPTVEAMDDAGKEFRRNMPRIVCRYDKGFEREARKRCLRYYEENIKKHGGPISVFPDGLSLAVAMDREIQAPFRMLSRSAQKNLKAEHKLGERGPSIKFPEDLAKSSHTIGVFFDPVENMEIMDFFDDLVSGLKRREGHLTEGEENAIRGFLESNTISPAFVRHVAGLYGDHNIERVFMLQACGAHHCLEYLLRRFKGSHFRKRYPPIGIL
jgi:hypothetical protein